MGNMTMPLRLDDLHGGEGSHRERKRVGRGHGSGKGKTAGRGTKGQKSRSGPGVRRGFEGGQLPIQQRMPYKRGFTNIYRTPWEVVNIGRLEAVQVDAFSDAARTAVEELGGSVSELDRTDQWVQARPRSRRLPLNRELKRARTGKVGGPTRREAISALAEREA